MRFFVGFLAAVTVAVLITVLGADERLGDPQDLATADRATPTGDAGEGPTSSAGADDGAEPGATTDDGDTATDTSGDGGVADDAAADGVAGEDTASDTAVEPEADDVTITMTFTGDLLTHGPVIAQAAANAAADPSSGLSHDYRPMFAAVREHIAGADLSVCVLETPISTDNTNLTGYPIFNAPRELADGIAATGWDGCAIASNHAFDQGVAGVVSTLDQLDRVRVNHSGTARTAEEKATPTLYEVNGVTIAHLSYTYGLNGFVLPTDQPYLVNVTNADEVLAEAARARAAGADFVVLQLQWGNEYQSDPSQEQLDLAQVFTASPDIDLVVGNHVHVIQPVDVVNGKYVIYGVGNFLSNQSAECCPAVSQDGVIMKVTVRGNDTAGYAVVDVTFTPTRVDRSNYTIVSLPEALADPNLDPGVRAVYEQSVAATTEVINRLGAGLEPTTAN